MGGGAEAVDAEALRSPALCHLERAVADQPGAQERRGFGVAIAVGQREGERASATVVGVAAIDRGSR